MNSRVYLDYASAAPMTKGVLAAMQPHLTKVYGNPGAQHTEGRVAKEALETVRKKVADVCKVRTEEVIFTSGATESNTLALLGHIEGLKREGLTYKDMHVITSAIEHTNILKSVAALKDRGVHVSVVFPDKEGIITPESIEKELTEKTVLVSIQYVNSEVGTIMPLRKIKQVLVDYSKNIILHTDAAQAAYFLPLLLEQVGVDMMTLDGQKFGGPRGVGVLIKKRQVQLSPIVFGGGQEGGFRPGTENVALATGFAYSLETAQSQYEEKKEEITKLRNWTIHEIERALDRVVVNGSLEKRIANNINISLLGRDTEYLAAFLDKEGFAVSTKTTCDTGVGAGSDVVRIITGEEKRALSTLRITLGPDTTQKQIKMFIAALVKGVAFIDENKI